MIDQDNEWMADDGLENMGFGCITMLGVGLLIALVLAMGVAAFSSDVLIIESQKKEVSND